jgi:hypothetical protein
MNALFLDSNQGPVVGRIVPDLVRNSEDLTAAHTMQQRSEGDRQDDLRTAQARAVGLACTLCHTNEHTFHNC